MKYKFHNVDLSHNDQVAIIEYAEQREWAYSDAIQSLVELDIKVSFGWDNFHDVAQMSLTPKKEEHPFHGYIVTFKHSDIHTLGKILLWLLAGGFDKLETPKEKSGRYDW